MTIRQWSHSLAKFQNVQGRQLPAIVMRHQTVVQYRPRQMPPSTASILTTVNRDPLPQMNRHDQVRNRRAGKRAQQPALVAVTGHNSTCHLLHVTDLNGRRYLVGSGREFSLLPSTRPHGSHSVFTAQLSDRGQLVTEPKQKIDPFVKHFQSKLCYDDTHQATQSSTVVTGLSEIAFRFKAVLKIVLSLNEHGEHIRWVWFQCS